MSFNIEEWKAAGAPDAELREHFELVAEIDREVFPEGPAMVWEEWRSGLVNVPSWVTKLRWAARSPAGELVGAATLSLRYLETNRHLASFDIAVRPAHRRKGVARALLAEVVAAAQADGRTLLDAGCRVATPSEAFLSAIGAERKLVERMSRCPLDQLDRSMLEQWVADAGGKAPGYSLVQWEDRCPDELLEAWADLQQVMNTAPHDDFEREDWIQTPERVREGEDKARAMGYRWWTVVARHDATGELAGWSEVAFDPWHPERVIQEGTGVRPEHRGRGIGRWVKAVNALRLLDERPDARYIETWNAFSNRWMLAINDDMGFEVTMAWGDWQVPTGTAAAAAGLPPASG